MYLTDEQASQHDCIGPQSCGQVIDKDNKTRRVCKGSACGMGWRWGHVTSDWSREGLEPGESLIGPSHHPSRTKGYCGLAGHPNPPIFLPKTEHHL